MERINTWLTLAANLGVLAGIVFLAYEIQVNTNAVRSSVATMGAGYTTQVWQLPIDNPELADVLRRGNQVGQKLTENEWFRYSLFYGAALRGFEQYFILHELGTMSDDQWEGWKLPLGQTLQEPGVRQVWKELRGQHASGFTELVDTLIRDLRESDTQGLIFSQPDES